MKKRINKKSGFTIVELILYMAIMGIFLTVLTEIFTSITGSRTDAEISSSISQDNTYVLAKFMYDIQRADSIGIPSAAGLNSTSLELSIDGVTNTYALSNGDLQLTNSSGTNNLNGFNTFISNLRFTRLGSSSDTDTISIEYTITSRQSDKTGTESKSVSTTIGLR